MRKGINVWCFPETYTIEQCIRSAKQAGFDGIEVNMEEEPREGDTRLLLSDPVGSARKIQELSQKYGLSVSSVSTSLSGKYSLGCPETREQGKTLVKAMIDAACVFGADTILIVPAFVNDETSYAQAYEGGIAGLKEIAGYAKEKKVYIGVENVWNKALVSPFDMKNFLDAVDEEYVQAYFDVGNVLQFSYPEYWIEVLGSRIKKVHVKDFVRASNTFVPLLAGDLNWKRTIEALRKAGYDSYLTAEVSPYREFPDMMAKHTSDSLSAILG